jgi:hypothetical protein
MEVGSINPEYGLIFQMGLKLHENQTVWRSTYKTDVVKSKIVKKATYEAISGWNRIGNA